LPTSLEPSAIGEQAHNFELERPLLRQPTAKPPFGLRLTLVGSLCTPTLIRSDNERVGWAMSHKLALTVPLHWQARWRNSPGIIPCSHVVKRAKGRNS
jgi:hypothetical protein